MLTQNELLQFKRDGYIIKDVLDKDEIAYYKGVIDGFAEQEMAKKASKMINLQFLQPKACIREMQKVVANKKITQIASELLGGGDVIIDGASLLCAKSGIIYKQGWHRDIMQIPDKDIDLNWFTKEHFHNNVQINIAIIPDDSLWYISGSHNRDFTPLEKEVFQGSLKMSPVSEVDLPDTVHVHLEPGQAAFYNNNGIHRGYAGKTGLLNANRNVIQLGYHSNKYEPTPHFGVINQKEFTKEYIDSLEPEVKAVVEAHIAERIKFPKSDEYYLQHQEFITNAFKTK